MSFILAFILLILSGLSVSVLTNKKFGIIMPVINMTSIFVLYFFGLFTVLYAGAIVTLTLLGVVILVTVMLTILPKTREKYISRLINEIKNPVVYIFLVLGLLFFIMLYNKEPANNDEFTHWLLVLKSMFQYGNFGNIGDTNTMFNRYEPGSSIFMYLFIFSKSKFWAGGAFAGFDFLLLSTLLPVMELFRKKTNILFVLSSIFAVLIVVIHKYNVFENLQVDVLLATVGAGVYAIWREDKEHKLFSFLALALGLFTLCCIKTAGIAVAIFLLIFLIVESLFLGKERLKKFFKTPVSYLYLILPIIAIVYMKVSWSLYCNTYVTKLGWSSEMSMKSIIDYFFAPNEFQLSVTNKFVTQFFIGPFGFDKSEGSIKQPQLFAILMFGLCALALGLKQKKVGRPITKWITATFILIAFAFGLLIQYIFSFAYWESNRLNAYYRYIQTASVFVSLVLYIDLVADIFVPYSEKIKNQEKVSFNVKFWIAVCIPVLIALSAVTGVRHIEFTNQAYNQLNRYKAWINVTEQLGDQFNVYYIIPDNKKTTRFYSNVPRYYATPTHCSGMNLGGAYVDGRESNSSYTGDPFYDTMTKGELINHLIEFNYTHLWLSKDNENFTKKFGDLFPENKPIKEVLYDISVDNEGNLALTVSSIQSSIE